MQESFSLVRVSETGLKHILASVLMISCSRNVALDFSSSVLPPPEGPETEVTSGTLAGSAPQVPVNGSRSSSSSSGSGEEY